MNSLGCLFKMLVRLSVSNSRITVVNPSHNLYLGLCGIAGVISLLSMGHIGKIFTDIQMIMFGCVMIGLGCVLFLDLEDDEKQMGDQSWRYSLTMFLVYSVGFPIGMHNTFVSLLDVG